MKFLTTDYSFLGSVGTYRIDADRGVRFEEYRGRTGLAELKSTISAMASDPCWTPGFHGLVDFSAADLVLSANDVLRLALVLRHEQFRTSGWLAYVATNSTTYGIIRMLGYWSRNTERMRIFPSRAEAEAWLELNRNLVPPGFLSENTPETPEFRNVG